MSVPVPGAKIELGTAMRLPKDAVVENWLLRKVAIANVTVPASPVKGMLDPSVGAVITHEIEIQSLPAEPCDAVGSRMMSSQALIIEGLVSEMETGIGVKGKEIFIPVVVGT